MSNDVKTTFSDVFQSVVIPKTTSVDELMRLPAQELYRWTVSQALHTVQGVGAICAKSDTLSEDVESIKKSVKNIEASLQSLDRSMKVLVQNQHMKQSPLRDLYELLKLHYGRGEDCDGAAAATSSSQSVDPSRFGGTPLTNEMRIVDVSHVTNEEFNEDITNPVNSSVLSESSDVLENTNLQFNVVVKQEPVESCEDEPPSLPRLYSNVNSTGVGSVPVKAAGKTLSTKPVRTSTLMGKRLSHREVRELSPLAKRNYQAWLKSQRNLRYRLNRQSRQQNGGREESEEEQVLFELSSEGSLERGGSSLSRSRSPQPINDGAAAVAAAESEQTTSPTFHFKSESRESDW